uniref:Protein-tyrosine-phosphatase n=1 Tax=Panagrolaimus sp. ES5 TaxID=591445 RepID=A0AC34F1M1_9BILA
MSIVSASKTSQSTHSFIHGFSEIRPFLYICGYYAITGQKIKDLQITYAIDASNILTAPRIPDVQYLYVRVDDDDISDIKKYFADTSMFIKTAKDAVRGGKILVYCAAGISRSATLCIMYLVIQENLSLRDAFNVVQNSRPGITPNLSFWRQMIEYESEKRGKSSVKFIKKYQISFPDVYLKNLNKRQKKKFCVIF